VQKMSAAYGVAVAVSAQPVTSAAPSAALLTTTAYIRWGAK
jgi:hypothetical protein